MFQKIKNLFWHLPKSIFYNIRYGYPAKKLILIGVTGTDGKTTTCTLIHHVLEQAGIKAGVITTIGAKISSSKQIDTGLHMTSPDSSLVQKILHEMLQSGVTHVVCEVTAHALDQHRYHGCNFKVAALTNTSHEHLDYYKNMENYVESKAKLFKQSETSILNKDDDSYKIINKLTTSPVLTYSINSKSDFQAKNIKMDSDFIQFTVNEFKLKSNTPYRYQIYNILAAFGVCSCLRIDQKTFQQAILNFPETKGRREEIANDFKIKTIVDFAHTPAAIKSTLESLKINTQENLIVIFGATGGRDKSKRPSMGQAATILANITILTADDTRDEKVEDINTQIASGIDSNKIKFIDYKELVSPAQFSKIHQEAKTKHIYLMINNRQDAFNFALKIAKTGDTVVACGKGHEATILHGSTEYPWSETDAFRTAFQFKKNK